MLVGVEGGSSNGREVDPIRERKRRKSVHTSTSEVCVCAGEEEVVVVVEPLLKSATISPTKPHREPNGRLSLRLCFLHDVTWFCRLEAVGDGNNKCVYNDRRVHTV